MKKIGIFGTTADPFTESHLAIIDKVLDDGLVDDVLIVPTIVDYHRQGKVKWLTESQKLGIIYSAIEISRNRRKMDVDICELEYSHMHSPFVNSERRFLHTLKDIIWKYSHNDDTYEFYPIVGTDSLSNFTYWYKWDEILKCSKLIGVLGRDGVDVKNHELCEHIIEIDERYGSISATEMRNRFSGSRNGFDRYLEYLIAKIKENNE